MSKKPSTEQSLYRKEALDYQLTIFNYTEKKDHNINILITLFLTIACFALFTFTLLFDLPRAIQGIGVGHISSGYIQVALEVPLDRHERVKSLAVGGEQRKGVKAVDCENVMGKEPVSSTTLCLKGLSEKVSSKIEGSRVVVYLDESLKMYRIFQ